jgi:hypothetical protein
MLRYATVFRVESSEKGEPEMKVSRLYATTARAALLMAVFDITSAYADNMAKSWPRDTNKYVRAPVAGDFNPMGKGTMPLIHQPKRGKFDIFIVDANAFNNNDPNHRGANENGIAINPLHINEVVITSFAMIDSLPSPERDVPVIPLWFSNNDGQTWAKDFSINAPTGIIVTNGFSDDQNADYTLRRGMAYATLVAGPTPELAQMSPPGTAIYAALTHNAAIGSFNWFAPGGLAQPANHRVNTTDVDQPWLLVGPVPDPAGAGVISENVYVAYDDFENSLARVAVAPANDPLTFNVDNPAGALVFNNPPTNLLNPGLRLAINKSSGAVYAAWQHGLKAGAGGSNNIDYVLNRSTDGGETWTLNGANEGIIVANADSSQSQPKFCTVNALLGGVDHIAVDPQTGDVIYVYGTRDPNTGSNRLALSRLTDNGNGLNVGKEIIFVDGDNVQAAIPSVAVTDDGVIGVFYYTCDGVDSSGFPAFSAHFDISTDGGNTFESRNILERFLSPVSDNNNLRQRILGDYMQVKAVGNTFYGSYVGNGINYGRNVNTPDPIYFNVAIDLNNERKKISRR